MDGIVPACSFVTIPDGSNLLILHEYHIIFNRHPPLVLPSTWKSNVRNRIHMYDVKGCLVVFAVLFFYVV